MISIDLSVPTRGENLQYVPHFLKTKALCLLAVKNDVVALKSVPITVLNDDFIKSAISYHDNAHKYIDNKYLTEEICRFIFQKNDTLRLVEELFDFDIIKGFLLSGRYNLKSNNISLERMKNFMLGHESHLKKNFLDILVAFGNYLPQDQQWKLENIAKELIHPEIRALKERLSNFEEIIPARQL